MGWPDPETRWARAVVAAELEADGVLKVLAYDTGGMDVQPGHRLGGSSGPWCVAVVRPLWVEVVNDLSLLLLLRLLRLLHWCVLLQNGR